MAFCALTCQSTIPYPIKLMLTSSATTGETEIGKVVSSGVQDPDLPGQHNETNLRNKYTAEEHGRIPWTGESAAP